MPVAKAAGAFERASESQGPEGRTVIIPAQARAEIQEALAAAGGQGDYVAVDILWIGLAQAAMGQDAGEERQRRQALVRQLPVAAARRITHLPDVDSLLDLDPPLDTILRHREHSSGGLPMWVESVRNNRDEDPVLAAEHLLKILANIRNRRAHGFKSIRGPRDEAVLGSARHLLEAYLRETLALDD